MNSNYNISLAKCVATAGGAGYAPKAPGTFGAIVGVILSVFMMVFIKDVQIIHYLHLGLIILFYFLGVWSCQVLEKIWGHDPSKIVIDETIGFWISIVFLPLEWDIIILGFILFRFFDILKPLGIRKIDKMHSHHSVMLDDVLAGIYANICLNVYLYYF